MLTHGIWGAVSAISKVETPSDSSGLLLLLLLLPISQYLPQPDTRQLDLHAHPRSTAKSTPERPQECPQPICASPWSWEALIVLDRDTEGLGDGKPASQHSRSPLIPGANSKPSSKPPGTAEPTDVQC